MLPRLYWCDCDMIENPPSVNDGEDEDEEVESLHHENCLLFFASTWSKVALDLDLDLVTWFKVDFVVIPLAALF